MKRNNNDNSILSIELDQINSDILGLITQNYNNIQILLLKKSQFQQFSVG